MKSIYHKLLSCLLLLLVHVTGSAQNVSAELDRDKIFIGEQITLRLKISAFNPEEKIVQGWFNVPDSVNHIEVVERSKIDTIQVNGLYGFEQTIKLTSFDSGQWELPPLAIIINNRARGEINTAATNPLSIQVLPVDVSQLKDYHDIKEIVEVEEKNDPLVIALLIAITLISLYAVYRLAMAKKKGIVKSKPLPGNLSPLAWALAELDKLKDQNIASAGEIKRYYQKLTDINREFFFRQFKQSAMQETTDEWMLELQSYRVDADTKTSFFQVLRLADTVKFAKYQPAASNHAEAVAVSKDMLTAVTRQPDHSSFQPKVKPI